MDPYMKEVRREMKRATKHFDLQMYVADAQYGIPTRCPCGSSIVDEVAVKEAADMLPGKRFFTCQNYQADGLHFRQPWVIAVEEEFRKMKTRGDEVEKGLKQSNDLLRADLLKVKEEVAQLKMRQAELERIL